MERLEQQLVDLIVVSVRPEGVVTFDFQPMLDMVTAMIEGIRD